MEEENKYHFAREMIFNLRACKAITDKVYQHWITKLIEDENQAKNNEVLDLVSGCYYLVKLMSDDEFEPALVVFIESENKNCFQFSNGVTVLCDSVNGYKEINYR